MQTIFFRLLRHEDKEAALRAAVDAANTGELAAHVFRVSPTSFNQVPGSPFAYWVSEQVRRLFKALPPFESEGRTVCSGPDTGQDFRCIRAWWEICVGDIGPEHLWAPHAKGGSFNPFYEDVYLLILWGRNGQRLKQITSANIRNESHYFRPGISWPLRTQKGLNFRVLPSGVVFGHKGPAVITNAQPAAYLAITNSRIFDVLVSVQMSFGSYEVGVIQRTPVPEQIDPAMAALALEAVNRKRAPEVTNEISHLFVSPLVPVEPQSLDDLQASIDALAFQMYGIEPDDLPAMERETASVPDENEVDEDEEPRLRVDAGQRQKNLLSYAVGCILGRWDIRYATGEKPIPDLPDPFAPLPVCSPGMLQEDDGLPLSAAPAGYPLRVDWDGIIPDDPDHSDDIVRRVRKILELIWKDRAEAIEEEACEILDVKELRDYFRKPGKGGFWDDHVSRYSKSRRKAPIYWLLQSSKKNYALWLYYHRLDKDILFKALMHYIVPKIRLEQGRLDTLRSQKTALGTAARGARKLDKDIDRQEALVLELKDFEDKLRRAANLDFGKDLDSSVIYDPDLNDGVVLNIAPLWELVPWKEAKGYWEELLAGEYEWSSMGKLLRKKGLVK